MCIKNEFNSISKVDDGITINTLQHYGLSLDTCSLQIEYIYCMMIPCDAIRL